MYRVTDHNTVRTSNLPAMVDLALRLHDDNDDDDDDVLTGVAEIEFEDMRVTVPTTGDCDALCPSNTCKASL